MRSNKKYILQSDFKLLLSSATQYHGSAAPAARVAAHTSWRRLWDVTLDHGVKGTRIVQAIFRELCRPSSCFQCLLCNSEVPSNSSCLEHACTNRRSEMENVSYEYLISLLIDADSASSIFSLCKRVSYSKCFWTFKHSQIFLLYNCMHYALWVTAIIINNNNNTHIAAIVPQPLTTHLQSWVDLLTFRPKYTFTILTRITVLTNLFAILTKLTILTRIILTELTIPLPR